MIKIRIWCSTINFQLQEREPKRTIYLYVMWFRSAERRLIDSRLSNDIRLIWFLSNNISIMNKIGTQLIIISNRKKSISQRVYNSIFMYTKIFYTFRILMSAAAAAAVEDTIQKKRKKRGRGRVMCLYIYEEGFDRFVFDCNV